MKIGKVELTKEKLIIAVAAAVAIATLGAYLVFFAPLMKALKTKYLECKSIETEAIHTRNIIETAGKFYGKRVLMTEKEVHQAINELTSRGKTEGVDFISMNPKEIKKEKGSQYKILPIEMKVESTYEELGALLGSLDDLEKGLVKVKSFDINPDEKDPLKFMTDLTVDVYISGKEDEK